MNDDISYYTFDNMDIYKSKYKKNILLYIIYVVLFVVANIIICFIKDDYLYSLIVAIMWLLFVNFSVFYIYKLILLPKKAYDLYKMLYFGNKRDVILTYNGECNVVVKQGLKFKEYTFIDSNNEIYKLCIYEFININYSLNKTYHLSLIDDYIYGGTIYEC